MFLYKVFSVILFLCLSLGGVTDSASAQTLSPGIHQKLLPINKRLGCLFSANDFVVSTDLVRLSTDRSNYRSSVPFKTVIRRRRAKQRRIKASIKSSSSKNDNSRVVSLQNRFNKVRSLTKEIRKCSRARADIGDGIIDSGVKYPITRQGVSSVNGGNKACDVVGSLRTGLVTRIINGSRCLQGDSPVLELLMYRNGKLVEACSGTAIGDRVILTAAHCAIDVNLAVITVQGVAHFSSDIHHHPSYTESGIISGANDVAIIRTLEDLNVRKAAVLGGADEIFTQEQILIAGYGLVDPAGNGKTDGITTAGLQAGFMNVSTVSDGEFRALYDFKKGGANTCNGDSGGPAFVKGNNQWYVGGVISYGFNGNCGPKDESGFADVTSKSVQTFIKRYTEREAE